MSVLNLLCNQIFKEVFRMSEPQRTYDDITDLSTRTIAGTTPSRAPLTLPDFIKQEERICNAIAQQYQHNADNQSGDGDEVKSDA